MLLRRLNTRSQNWPRKNLENILRCFPQASASDVKCMKEVFSSIKKCNKKNCIIKIGGKTSKCLSLKDATVSYTKTVFDSLINIGGQIKPTGGISIEFNLKTGDIAVELYGTIEMSTNISLRYNKLYDMDIKKKIDLATPKTILKHLINIPLRTCCIAHLIGSNSTPDC